MILFMYNAIWKHKVILKSLGDKGVFALQCMFSIRKNDNLIELGIIEAGELFQELADFARTLTHFADQYCIV